MIVYRVEAQPREFQSIRFADPSVAISFDGTPKLPGWQPLAVTLVNPELPRGNFLHLTEDCFAIDAKAAWEIGELVEHCVEFLPVDLVETGERLHLLNVTGLCKDFSDRLTKRWLSQNREGYPLFRSPAGLCMRTVKLGREDCFPTLAERGGLTGLIWTKVWEREPLDITPILQRGIELFAARGKVTDELADRIARAHDLEWDWDEGWYEFRDRTRERVAMFNLRGRVVLAYTKYAACFPDEEAATIAFDDWSSDFLSINPEWLGQEKRWCDFFEDPDAFCAWSFASNNL